MAKKIAEADLALEKIVRKNEWQLLDRFGNTSRGHNIPCRFCGWLSSVHESMTEPHEDEKVAQRGFRISLVKCVEEVGYAPINVREWEKAEREFQKEKKWEDENFDGAGSDYDDA